MNEESKNDRILAEIRKRRREMKILEVKEERTKLILFSLHGKAYAFPGADVKEILRREKITFVPGSSDVVLGIINVRGDVESVLDVHKVLGLPEPVTAAANRIVIGEEAGIRSGMLVDSVDDVVDVPSSSIQPPISTLSGAVKDFVAGETVFGDRNVTILSVGRLLRKMLP